MEEIRCTQCGEHAFRLSMLEKPGNGYIQEGTSMRAVYFWCSRICGKQFLRNYGYTETEIEQRFKEADEKQVPPLYYAPVFLTKKD